MPAWNAVSWAVLAVSGFVTTAVLYRVVGPAGFGVWATVTALKTYMTFLDGGLAFGVTRSSAQRPAKAETERSIGAACLIYLALAVCALALSLLFMGLPATILGLPVTSADTSGAVMAIAGVETAVALAFSPVRAILRGRSRFDALALTATVQAVIQTTLVLAFAPVWGLVGVGVALVLARVVSGLCSAILLTSQHLKILTLRVGLPDVRRVMRFAAPLWFVAAGTQVGFGTDIPIVGAFFGPDVAGAYAVGATLPLVAVGLLFALIDTAFPRLVDSRKPERQDRSRRLLVVGSLLASFGFGSLALHAEAVLTVWVGSAVPLTVTVLVIYSLVWALNTPVHVLVLHAVALDRHTVLGPIVICEALANIVLSLVLAVLGFPTGPAVATLLTLGISNLLVLPPLLARRLDLKMTDVVLSAGRGYLIGAASATGVWAVFAALSPGPVTTLLAVAGATSAAGLAMAAAVLGHPALQRRAFERRAAIVLHSGWRVMLRERKEARLEKQERLLGVPQSPSIWLKSDQPLVTVRIATYNRGRLVAERAIASALAQTHSNLEILVIGDHCDEDTERAVLSVRDPRVKFENLPVRGAYPHDPMHRWMVAGSAPMNRGLEVARGEWIAPLDDDDEFTPDHIDVLLDTCRTRNAELAFGVADMEIERGHWMAVGSWPLQETKIVHSSVLLSSSLRHFRYALDAWRLLEPGDWNLWKRMRKAGVQMAFVNQVVCRHYLERHEIRDSKDGGTT